MSKGIAEAYLRELKNAVGRSQFRRIFDNVQYELRLDKLTLEDIDASESCVRQMKTEACRREARRLLAQLVENPDSDKARGWAEELLEEHREGRFLLSEIGTSVESLQQFFSDE